MPPFTLGGLSLLCTSYISLHRLPHRPAPALFQDSKTDHTDSTRLTEILPCSTLNYFELLSNPSFVFPSFRVVVFRGHRKACFISLPGLPILFPGDAAPSSKEAQLYSLRPFPHGFPELPAPAVLKVSSKR